MSNILDSILKFYANKYFVGPLSFTLIFSVILFSPYTSTGNFDLVISFFGYLIIISALLLCVFIHNIFNDRKDFIDLFAIAFISLITSIMTIIFFRTHSFLSHFAIIGAMVCTFMFFTIFKEIIVKIKADAYK